MLGNLNRLIAIDKKSTHIFTAFLRHQRRDLCPLFRLRDCTYNLKSSCICFKIPLLGTKTKHKLVDDFGPPLATQLMLQSICLTCCCTKDYHRIPTHHPSPPIPRAIMCAFCSSGQYSTCGNPTI